MRINSSFRWLSIMSKQPRRPPDHSKFEAFARRRAGAGYCDASFAVKDRLLKLKEDYERAPLSYRGYLAVGICSCLESHIKYSYADAAERFSDHPELLKVLFNDIGVDIATLISATSKKFNLSDVVAASISVSTLSAYRSKASHFLGTFMDASHDFPWDYLRILTNGSADLEKEYAGRLVRLERVFDIRHRFVHETDPLIASEQFDLSDAELLECANDAIELITQFQKQFDEIQMGPKYAAVRDDEGLDDAIGRSLKEIDEAFEQIRLVCDKQQHESLEKFKNSFLEYLWARAGFKASVFIAQRSEATASYFLDLAPEYRQMLKQLSLQQKYLLSQFPLAQQYAELGLDFEGES